MVRSIQALQAPESEAFQRLHTLEGGLINYPDGT